MIWCMFTLCFVQWCFWKNFIQWMNHSLSLTCTDSLYPKKTLLYESHGRFTSPQRLTTEWANGIQVWVRSVLLEILSPAIVPKMLIVFEYNIPSTLNPSLNLSVQQPCHFCLYKSLGSFSWLLSQELGPECLLCKCSAVSGELSSEFTTSEKP